MELYFLDRNFSAVSPPVDTATSLVWSLRYGECGTFAADLPLTQGTYGGAAYTAKELLSLLNSDKYKELFNMEHFKPLLECSTDEALAKVRGNPKRFFPFHYH